MSIQSIIKTFTKAAGKTPTWDEIQSNSRKAKNLNKAIRLFNACKDPHQKEVHYNKVMELKKKYGY